MNLFHNSSLTELSTLLGQCSNPENKFHLVVEHDGEVLISDSKIPKRTLRKYKFYISGLHGKMYVGASAAKNLDYLNQLYKNLMFCWEKDLKGAIDYAKISGIQKISLWLEMKNISNNIAYGLISVLFKNDTREQHTIA